MKVSGVPPLPVRAAAPAVQPGGATGLGKALRALLVAAAALALAVAIAVAVGVVSSQPALATNGGGEHHGQRHHPADARQSWNPPPDSPHRTVSATPAGPADRAPVADGGGHAAPVQPAPPVDTAPPVPADPGPPAPVDPAPPVPADPGPPVRVDPAPAVPVDPAPATPADTAPAGTAATASSTNESATSTVTATETATATPATGASATVDPAPATTADPAIPPATSVTPAGPSPTAAPATTPAPPPAQTRTAPLQVAAQPAAAAPAGACVTSLATLVSSAAQTMFGGLLGILDDIDLGSLLNGLGGPVRRAPPGGPSPVPEPDHLLAPLIVAGSGAAHARGGSPADAVLPARWPHGLVLGRAHLFPPAARQAAFVPLQIERPG